MNRISTTILLGYLMLLAPWVQAQLSAGSNDMPSKIWILTDFEKANARVDLHLYCPWAAITNKSSWFFRSGTASEAQLSGNGSRSQYQGSISSIDIHCIQSENTSNISFELKWDGNAQGMDHRINTRFAIPVCQTTTGVIKYVGYDTPYPDPLSKGKVGYLNYKAFWTTKPKIGPMEH